MAAVAAGDPRPASRPPLGALRGVLEQLWLQPSPVGPHLRHLPRAAEGGPRGHDDRRRRLPVARGNAARPPAAAAVPGHAGPVPDHPATGCFITPQSRTRNRPLMILRVGVSGISGTTTRRSGSLFLAMFLLNR